MSKGDPILLPFDKAEQVLASDAQIIKITDEKGNWTGKTLNKSFLVSTDIDVQATREENMRLAREGRTIELKKPDERGTKAMSEILERSKPEFLKEPN